MRPFDGRQILLVVSGGIAAYKVPEILRRLRSGGAVAEVVLTRNAERFVGRATFEGLTGRSAHRSLWERPLAHIELGREADAALVAPATADLVARMAGGRADDMAATTLLAAACPVVVCPAMNLRMWKNPATRENVNRLRERGFRMVGPERGELAEGEVGPGRMSEPDRILAELGRVLEADSPLAGRRVIVTAGPTRAPIDPVRYLSSRSSGRTGYALAASAWRRGAEVTLISGPASVPSPHGPRLLPVETSAEMLTRLRESLEPGSVLLMAAAVSDFRPSRVREHKIRKASGQPELELEAGPDLLAETRDLRREKGVFSLGFALETASGPENARRKLEEKGLDLVALNEVGDAETGFDSPTNRIVLFDAAGHSEEFPLLLKEEVADRLLDRIEERLEE